jgi:hypothetical protein
MLRAKRNFVCLLSLLPLAASAQAQSIEMPWSTITGGGGRMSSGNGVIVLNCTLAEPMVGSLSGGVFEVSCGFWVGLPGDCTLPGDLDGNHHVELADLTQLLSNFGVLHGADPSDGDGDGDGDVDLADLTLLLSHFGDACP